MGEKVTLFCSFYSFYHKGIDIESYMWYNDSRKFITYNIIFERRQRDYYGIWKQSASAHEGNEGIL